MLDPISAVSACNVDSLSSKAIQVQAMKSRVALVLSVVFELAAADSIADQEIRAARAETLPTIDGEADDNAWAEAKAITTRDLIAGIDITLKAVHDGTHLAFLIHYPDDHENRQHKTMVWNTDLEMYGTGPKREDVFVFKWSMEPNPVDLTLSSETPYKADIWYWKAHRTDHAGYADDKNQLYVPDPLPYGKRLVSENGNLFYLVRSGDSGEAAYRAMVHTDYVGPEAPRFEMQTPTGSRADIEAKGLWKNGFWTIELVRRLRTGQTDDIAFDIRRGYQFGVSRFEIAARKPDQRLEEPRFGCGEIGENLTLVFD
jgi:hypothetical protein